MRLLLDTHVVIWWLESPSALSAEAMTAIKDPENDVFVSAASVWEIAIKTSLGKLDLQDPGFPQSLRDEDGFQQLSVTWSHSVIAGDLPRHHNDPFDRMLIAQAQAEGLTTVTRDAHFAAYDVPLIRT